MSQDTRHEIARKKVVYQIPGAGAATVLRDEPYRVTGHGPLTMDLYYPPAKTGARLPAVVVICGYSGARTPNPLGCSFKEMEWSISWGHLMAASGLVAIFATNREPEPDVHALLRHVRQNAERLGIDEDRMGVFATSGNGPLALSVLMGGAREYLKGAVLWYPYTLDLDGSTGIADATRQWGFVNPCAGKSLDDLPRDLPLFLAKAGQDQMPGLNAALDRFIAQAVARNLRLTFVNHHTGPHAFDLFDDSGATHEIIRQTLAFQRFHLSA
jgi:dienelactone hydrolase